MKNLNNISFLLFIFSGFTISGCNRENKTIDVSNLCANYFSKEEQQNKLGMTVTVNSTLSLNPDSTFLLAMENANSDHPAAMAGKWKLAGTAITLLDSNEVKMPPVFLTVNAGGSLSGKYIDNNFAFHKCDK